MKIEPGVYTALLTLTKGDKSERMNDIDFDETLRLAERQKMAGVTGGVILGTTGQSSTILDEDREALIGEMVPYLMKLGMVPIVGCGSNSTDVAVRESEFAARLGAEIPLLHVTGYYNNPTQKGLLAHFGEIARAVPNPIIIYNVPGRTANYILPETVIELANKYPNIVGLKQAVDFSKARQEKGDKPNYRADTEKILKEVPANFSVFSGEDNLVAEGMELGFKGVISASANIRPHHFVKIVKAGLEGRVDDMREVQTEVNPVVAAMFLRKNPLPLHLCLGSHPRLPMTLEDFTIEDKLKIQAALDGCPSPDPYFNVKIR